MFDANRKIKFLFAFIFLLYVIALLTTNHFAQSKPRQVTDSTFYIKISQQPLLDMRFWGRRAPMLPLLLKIVKQDISLTSHIQLIFSMLAWAFFAFMISASIRTLWLKPLSFGVILALSLVRHLASWNFVILTESLSISLFVLFLGLGIWLSHGWRVDKVVALCVAGIFLAFTRDTNAYLLLMLAGMLTLGILFRWIKPRVLILVTFFLFTFILLYESAEIGERWVFPLDNIVGRRVLTDPQATAYLESCGMPLNSRLLVMGGEYGTGQNYAFFYDPALEGYRGWLKEHGKICYMKWLLSDPIESMAQSLTQFQELIAFKDVSGFFARKYDPIVPWFIEPFIYPVTFIIPLWIVLTAVALIATWKKAWNINPLWGIYILLCLPILPHLFIVWHGDTMDSNRHALSIGLQLAICFWMAVFLLLDQLVQSRRNV